MNRRPDSWEDPPEDEPEQDPNDDGDYAYDSWKDKQHEKDLGWDTPTNHPYVDRDCDYWNRIT